MISDVSLTVKCQDTYLIKKKNFQFYFVTLCRFPFTILKKLHLFKRWSCLLHMLQWPFRDLRGTTSHWQLVSYDLSLGQQQWTNTQDCLTGQLTKTSNRYNMILISTLWNTGDIISLWGSCTEQRKTVFMNEQSKILRGLLHVNKCARLQ